MGRERFSGFERADSIFWRALEQLPEDRDAFVREACGSDTELLAEVQELLALALRESGSLAPGGGLRAALMRRHVVGVDQARAGERFGPWRIRDEIGRGGMALVYLAERADGAYRQQVALKLLRRIGGPESVEQRFERERSLLAQLEHANIARLLDGGTTEDGRSYIVMEYVEGEPIDRYCDAQQLSIAERLEIFLAVCDAVQFAHRQLIVHRDIKPTNILVTPDGVPKLLDFGIAKILEPESDLDDPTRTRLGDRMLTPQYASPEQVLGEPVSIATDVHALGLLLYELLSGHRARKIDSTRPSEIEKAICDTLPPVPSLACVTDVPAGTDRGALSPTRVAAARGQTPTRLKRTLRGDLDNIVMMALRREPERRYATAEQMAGDIRNFLALRPVRARPDTAAYRVERFVRRHATGVVISLGVAVLIAATAGYYTDRLARERNAAELAGEQARIEAEQAEQVTDFLVDLFRAAEPDRPADQLPDTEKLLELGAERAMDESSAPPEVRLRMLEVMGYVYMEQGRFDQARPLLDEAVSLARTLHSEQPRELAEALITRSSLAWRSVGPRDAEGYLLEAESLIAEDERHLELWVRAVMDRAWAISIQRDHKRAAEVLEPVYHRIRDRADLNPARLYRVIERLSSIHQQLGNLDVSSRLRAEAKPHLLRAHGPESRAYAVYLANTSNLEYMLGRFELAEQLNRQALALYDRIYLDRPAPFRAVARRNLVRKLLTRGRFEEGLAELKQSTGELARVYEIPPDDHASHHYYFGEMMLMMRRWSEAKSHLEWALALYAEAEDVSEFWLRSTNAMLVWAMCQEGRSDGAVTRFEELESKLEEPLSAGGSAEARIRSARACMHWRQGNFEWALSEVDRALALVSDAGALLERAERMILRARILASMGQKDAVLAQLSTVARLFTDQGLSDHPNFSDLRRIERELENAVDAADL